MEFFNIWGKCISHGDSWEQYKALGLKEYFPLFVRKKVIRELLVFYFQERVSTLRKFINEEVDAAEFLQFRASEEELLDSILTDLHPQILAQAAFLPRPRAYIELKDMVGLEEERLPVLTERQSLDTGSSSSQMVEKGKLSDKKAGGAAGVGKQSSKNEPTCWRCGKEDMFRGIVMDVFPQVP